MRFREEMRRLRTAGTCRAPRQGKKEGQPAVFLSSLNSYLSLVGIAWVQMVDCVSRKRTRQSGYSCVSFSAFSQFTDSVLLRIRFTLRRRDKQSRATRLRVVTDGTCELHLSGNSHLLISNSCLAGVFHSESKIKPRRYKAAYTHLRVRREDEILLRKQIFRVCTEQLRVFLDIRCKFGHIVRGDSLTRT